MMKLKVSRIYQDDCTVGVLNYAGFRCYTLELPDKCNKQNESCIPSGTYECSKHHSPSQGLCVAVNGVVGRSHILIHKGNYTSDIMGCILVGDSIRDINRDKIPDVTNSTNTLKDLLKLLPDKFLMEIS